MEIILNKIAIWQPVGAKVLNVKLSPRGQKYLEKDNPVFLEAKNGLKRCVKDYEDGNIKFSLFVRTLPEVDDTLIETSLDNVAKKILKEQILKALASATTDKFTYTNHFVEENK